MKYEEFEARAKSAFDDCSEMKRMLWNMQTVVGAVPDMVRKNERLDRERAELKAELDDWKGNAEGFEPDAYMRLPVDADGVPIRIGDEVNIDGNAMTVLGYRLRNDMLLLVVEDKKMGLLFAPEPSRVRHFKPEPLESEVLGADGVPIEVGDTVYCDDDPEQLIVDSFDDQGCVCITLAKSPNGILYTIEPSRLFHECPDSWEKLEEDTKMGACDYAHAPRDEYGITVCRDCRFQKGKSCRQEMILDMIARAKRLAVAEEKEGE